MIIHKVIVIKDGEVRNTFYYTNEEHANKTIIDSTRNGYEVIKETTELNS